MRSSLLAKRTQLLPLSRLLLLILIMLCCTFACRFSGEPRQTEQRNRDGDRQARDKQAHSCPPRQLSFNHYSLMYRSNRWGEVPQAVAKKLDPSLSKSHTHLPAKVNAAVPKEKVAAGEPTPVTGNADTGNLEATTPTVAPEGLATLTTEETPPATLDEEKQDSVVVPVLPAEAANTVVAVPADTSNEDVERDVAEPQLPIENIAAEKAITEVASGESVTAEKPTVEEPPVAPPVTAPAIDAAPKSPILFPRQNQEVPSGREKATEEDSMAADQAKPEPENSPAAAHNNASAPESKDRPEQSARAMLDQQNAPAASPIDPQLKPAPQTKEGALVHRKRGAISKDDVIVFGAIVLGFLLVVWIRMHYDFYRP